MNTIGANTVLSNYVKSLVQDKYNYRSGYAYYDSLTHYYLGKYLRDYNDEKGIDLRSMYNCYSENMISNYRLKASNYMQGNKVNYQCRILKISSDSTYDLVYINILPKDCVTLYFETDLPITIAVGSYNGVDFIDNNFDNVLVIPSASIDKPIKYQVPNYSTDQKDNSYRVDNLVLLIQVPRGCWKRAVLLGDYTQQAEVITSRENNDTNNYILPNISSFFVDGKSQAFCDDLISYITEYAITEDDWIYNNITRVQELMSSYSLRNKYGMRYQTNYTKGDLDVNMRSWIKEFQRNVVTKHNNKNGKYNNTGRINKDVEELLDRGGSLQ